MLSVHARCLDHDGSRLDGDLRFDSGDLSVKRSARKRIDGKVYRLPGCEPPKHLLGQSEIDIQGAEISERRNRLSRLEILAKVNLTDAERSIEGRANKLLRDQGLGASNMTACLVETTLLGVHIALRHGSPI